MEEGAKGGGIEGRGQEREGEKSKEEKERKGLESRLDNGNSRGDTRDRCVADPGPWTAPLRRRTRTSGVSRLPSGSTLSNEAL